jgi:hypothetical protein
MYNHEFLPIRPLITPVLSEKKFYSAFREDTGLFNDFLIVLY